MKKKTFLFVFVSLGLLAACSDNLESVQQVEQVKTVQEWINTEPDIFIAKLRECNANPGVMQHNPNCINIHSATLEVGRNIWGEEFPAANEGLTLDEYRAKKASDEQREREHEKFFETGN